MATRTNADAARQFGLARTTLDKRLAPGTRSATPEGLIDTAELGRVLSTMNVPLNCSPCVAGCRWGPWAREDREEVRVCAGDAPCHGEETRRASARLYALQSVRN